VYETTIRQLTISARAISHGAKSEKNAATSPEVRLDMTVFF
jgi:hypothetical protein